ncbi:ALA-interacting subunit 1-like [Neltuma alba]|uniref:ALA-interacting subunit 1-like n=1 Tax=Neltuma alba TaxID=207710 RepID=UPI0010A3DE49|nr:ALA-interacting subunit 1-like [Prosopis alba]XP_028801001.1 ALA-interacting subunit 1-like [Prosopis alba]
MTSSSSTSAAANVGPSASSSSSSNGKKPKYSKFSQQELSAWQPIITPSWVITQFTVIAVIFIPLGLASLSASERVVEISYRYDQECIPYKYSDDEVAFIQSTATKKTCIRRWIVTKKMKAPIYVYYQLDNFYQNHRRFVKSRDDKQLRNKADEKGSSSCEPELNYDGKPIVPCGLIAWSLFNDTFSLSANNKTLLIDKKNIAWKSDKTKRFGSDVYPKNFQQGNLIGGAKLNESIPLSEQEDLMVWMRTAPLSSFRKLYGKIETDLEVNDELDIVIQNNYNTYSYGGKKVLVLSTTTWIGGRNDFVGMACLAIGGLSLLFELVFMSMHVMKPRPLGDPSYLSWNKYSEKDRVG